MTAALSTAGYLRAEPQHSTALAALMQHCFLQAYSHASTPERIARFVAQAYAPEQLCTELGNPQLPTWIVIDQQDRWAGFGRLNRSGPAHPTVSGQQPMELQRFYLAPQYHGTQMAAPLMAFLMEQAQAYGADVLWLNVWKDAPQAIRFYQKQGFQVVGSTTFWVDNDPKDDWVMQRRL